ncbi:hypothetical protein [Idiomarina zobellii]|uniref:Type II toxin-antitoxin system RelE/ParE family toxin n=1 Tax=Idiomarina zobellii TaxID=86103 RepID=A0A837NCM4_9GAMM|nr:hypothetical protein [Idiomarina zobellii]KPD20435.1 hypothetical protein AFK76_12600 [Idiomarina zobellii]SDG36540.1 hypothetical protein SAMN04515658_1291 [Idiomarina zobellii]
MKHSSEFYRVEASRVFKLSTRRFRSFIEHNYSESIADKVIANIKDRIKEQLPVNPKIGPISERLLSLGVADYRQWLVDDYNLVFYKVDEANQKVELLLLMSTKQNIRKLLFEVNLLI